MEQSGRAKWMKLAFFFQPLEGRQMKSIHGSRQLRAGRSSCWPARFVSLIVTHGSFIFYSKRSTGRFGGFWISRRNFVVEKESYKICDNSVVYWPIYCVFIPFDSSFNALTNIFCNKLDPDRRLTGNPRQSHGDVEKWLTLDRCRHVFFIN